MAWSGEARPAWLGSAGMARRTRLGESRYGSSRQSGAWLGSVFARPGKAGGARPGGAQLGNKAGNQPEESNGSDLRWKGSELGGSAQSLVSGSPNSGQGQEEDENLLAQDVVNDARSRNPLCIGISVGRHGSCRTIPASEARALIKIEVVYKAQPAKGKQTITVAVAHPPKTSLPTPKLPEPSRAGEIRAWAFVSVGRSGAPGYVTAAEIVDNKVERDGSPLGDGSTRWSQDAIQASQRTFEHFAGRSSCGDLQAD